MIPSLRHMFSECRVVSFDIFDTLLKRHVKKPTDIFEIVQIQYNKEHGKHLDSFKNDRITAERNARLTAKQEDISLDDIYANLPYSDTEKKELKQIELSLEAIFLASNRRLKNLFEEAQKRGKEIIITSDMYLPHPFLLDILKREGYTGYIKLYLSSKEGLLKSTGNLFKLATTELNCKPKEILHIGDSRRGDFLAPLKLGVKVCPIKTFYQRLTYHPILKEQSLSRNILCSFLNNTIHGDHYFQLGYETLGTLLYGFCH